LQESNFPDRRFAIYSFVPLQKTNNRVPFLEERVLLARGRNFFVLDYTAPEKLFPQFRPVYQRIIKTFMPDPKYSSASATSLNDSSLQKAIKTPQKH